MKTRAKWITGAAVTAALLGVGTGVAVAATQDDDDNTPPITGTDRVQAERAALEHTGGGRVTETEVGDEESLYEVEVTMPDGRQIDVQLDEQFAVVGSEADHENETDDD